MHVLLTFNNITDLLKELESEYMEHLYNFVGHSLLLGHSSVQKSPINVKILQNHTWDFPKKLMYENRRIVRIPFVFLFLAGARNGDNYKFNYIFCIFRVCSIGVKLFGGIVIILLDFGTRSEMYIFGRCPKMGQGKFSLIIIM